MTGTLRLALGVSAAGGVAAACIYHATYGVRSQWLGPTVWRGPLDTASAALTFDDGPTDDTERILDELGAAGIRAVFFMVGRQVERHPQIARRVVADGHEVGNHSYSHPLYLYCSATAIARELGRTQEVIAATTGVTPRWSRPPYGVRSPAYFTAARALGLPTVQWTVAGYDWRRRSAQTIARSVVRGLTAGAIVLLHDGDSEGRRDRRATAAAVPAIIGAARARQLRLCSLAGLLDACPPSISEESHGLT